MIELWVCVHPSCIEVIEIVIWVYGYPSCEEVIAVGVGLVPYPSCVEVIVVWFCVHPSLCKGNCCLALCPSLLCRGDCVLAFYLIPLVYKCLYLREE